ncbi:MAG: sugar phosphate isomerase/epimerase family protein [Promethearchaeota archaeon]|jgi:sugar phosphate isomerase/epimerase
MKGILNKISFHAIYNNNILESLHYAKEKGFSGIQIATEVPHFSFENLSNEQFSEIREFCEKEQLYITIHGPDIVTSLFTTNPHLKKGIFSYYKELFIFAEKINSKLISIHLGNITKYRTDTTPELELPEDDIKIYENVLKENLKTLLKLGNDDFFICIENYKMDLLILDILQPFLTRRDIWLCWDLAKTFTSSGIINKKLENFYIDNIKSIKQVHLHDLDSDGKSHRVVGSGIIDFKYFLKKFINLEVLDYCIEVRPHEKAYESLTNLRRIIELK